LDRLPTVDPTSEKKTTEQALRLAKEYIGYVAHLQQHFPGRFKKKHKHWFKNQCDGYNSQKILDSCGGDLNLADQMLRHAFISPQHQKAAGKDLYSLWGRWKLIEKSYAELKEQDSTQQQQKTEREARGE
jgi:uncharacterized short protein YbdD (DUF466 family)